MILRNNVFEYIVTAKCISLTEMTYLMVIQLLQVISLNKHRYKVDSISFCDRIMRHVLHFRI